MEAKHTPTPWVATNAGIEHACGLVCFTAQPREACETRLRGECWLDMRQRTQHVRDAIEAEEAANADFIVRACNSHDALVEALKHARDEISIAPRSLGYAITALPKIDAALALAGETP